MLLMFRPETPLSLSSTSFAHLALTSPSKHTAYRSTSPKLTYTVETVVLDSTLTERKLYYTAQQCSNGAVFSRGRVNLDAGIVFVDSHPPHSRFQSVVTL